MELQPYVALEDVIKLAVKIDRQQKRGTTRVTKPVHPLQRIILPRQPQNKNLRRRPPSQPWLIKERPRSSPPNPQGAMTLSASKCLGHRHIAFQCPNRKVMIVRDAVEEIVSEDEFDSRVEEEEEQVTYPEEGELLVIH